MGFCSKFPQNVLYFHKSTLGIGLMEPSTIIDILKLKSYIRNKRKRGNTHKAIQVQENMRSIGAGGNVKLGENPQKRYWKET